MAEGGIVKANQGGVVPLPRSRPTNDPALAWEDLHNRLVDSPNLAKFHSFGEGDIGKELHGYPQDRPGPGMDPFGENIHESLKRAEKEFSGPLKFPESHYDIQPKKQFPRDWKFDPETGKPIGQEINYVPSVPRATIGRQAAQDYNKHVLDLATIQSGADNWVV